MRRSLAYPPGSSSYNGWGSFEHAPHTSSNLPCYPHHKASFHNEDCYEGHKANHKHQHKHHKPKFQETVEVIEYDTADHRAEGRSHGVYEQSIDSEADSFILQKHKAFERSKSTFY